jgi:DNA ligase (NAD+)
MSKQLKLSDSGKVKKALAERKRINDLRAEIEYHQHLYYNAQPEISDEDFDAMWDELRRLDPNNEVFSKVGTDFDPNLEKITHIIPMNSQDKVNTPEEFYKWAKKRNYPRFLVQYKLDGISIELQYIKGKFQYGVTRGDGVIGDNITSNVQKMKGYKEFIDKGFTGAIRGEILLTRDTFNRKYALDNKNPRNTASGITKRKDGEGSEDLWIMAYDAININPREEFRIESEKLEWMEEQDFDVVKTQTFENVKDVINYRDEIMTHIREQLNFEIDGLVIKGEKIDLKDMKRARPMKQIAFKFDPEESETTVIAVEWSESGAIYTPVAIVEPVEIAGTTVQRASLANPDLIATLGLKIGSKVIISKRGEIIPKIESVLENPPNAKPIEVPTICSTCNTKLINEGTILYCPNEQCPKKEYFRLVKWIKTLNIKDFGDLILKQLFDSGKVRKIADLYDLTPNDLIKLERVKEKSANKALENLFAVKEISLAKFIGGFNLENIGERQALKIVNAGFDTLEKIKNASISEFAKVEGFGSITGKLLYDGIKALYPDMENVLMKEKITIRGVEKKMGTLEGKTFCFTGKLNSMKRKEAEELVAKHGGSSRSSVSGALSYLVTNSTEPTAKFVKAQELGIKIITEQDFLNMLKE